MFHGKYNDFTTDWYDNVGITFVLILIIDNVTFNLFLIIRVLVLRLKRVFLAGVRCVDPTIE